jgi:hypothetical protein
VKPIPRPTSEASPRSLVEFFGCEVTCQISAVSIKEIVAVTSERIVSMQKDFARRSQQLDRRYQLWIAKKAVRDAVRISPMNWGGSVWWVAGGARGRSQGSQGCQGNGLSRAWISLRTTYRWEESLRGNSQRLSELKEAEGAYSWWRAENNIARWARIERRSIFIDGPWDYIIWWHSAFNSHEGCIHAWLKPVASCDDQPHSP